MNLQASRVAQAPSPINRRGMIRSLAGSGLLLPGLLSELLGDDTTKDRAGNATGAPHFAPKAKRVIFLFMTGGVSHIDTFDPKPAYTDGYRRPRTPFSCLFDVVGRRRNSRRHRPWSERRICRQRRRERSWRPRPSSHHPAPARPGPRTSDLSPRRPRFSAHRCARSCGP